MTWTPFCLRSPSASGDAGVVVDGGDGEGGDVRMFGGPAEHRDLALRRAVAELDFRHQAGLFQVQVPFGVLHARHAMFQ